jgi:hypothetical protein
MSFLQHPDHENHEVEKRHKRVAAEHDTNAAVGVDNSGGR